MSNAENLIIVKYLLGVVAALSGCSVALIIFIAKKYIRIIDKNHERLNAIETEHKVFHKCETGL